MIRAIALALGLVVGLGHLPAPAQDYPNRPVRLVVPFGAGGPTDVIARLIANDLTERLGQPVVIDNRPGAGGNIGAQAVVKAAADGYTLLVIAHTNAINHTLYTKVPFDFLTDIVPVSPMVRVTNVMVVTPSFPAKTVAEFIAYANANPGKVNYCSAGSGTSGHLGAELFQSMTDIRLVHVPYRTSVAALTDLMSGQVHVMFDLIPSSIGHIRAGKLRALAVTSPQRNDVLPGVPTVSETVPGFVMQGWLGVGAPRGTPAGAVERLNREINAALRSKKLKARLAELNADVMSGGAAEFRKFVADETEKWGKVVRMSGAKVE